MYQAKLFVETGFGLSIKLVKVDSFTSLKTVVNNYKALVLSRSMAISKIVYYYPSGKIYTEKLV